MTLLMAIETRNPPSESTVMNAYEGDEIIEYGQGDATPQYGTPRTEDEPFQGARPREPTYRDEPFQGARPREPTYSPAYHPPSHPRREENAPARMHLPTYDGKGKWETFIRQFETITRRWSEDKKLNTSFLT